MQPLARRPGQRMRRAMTTTLWLVRHPAPQMPPGLCYGRLDVAADAAAVEAAAQRWHARLPPRVRLVASPARRAHALAEALRQRRALAAPVAVDERLQELDFGAWEGQPWTDIPMAELHAWCADFAHYRPGGGESVAALLQRVRSALRDARAAAANLAVAGKASPAGAPQALVWITHAGVIRAVRYTLRHGERALPAVAQHWPRRAPAFGGGLRIDLTARDFP